MMYICTKIYVKSLLLQNTHMRQDLQRQTGIMYSNLKENMMGKV